MSNDTHHSNFVNQNKKLIGAIESQKICKPTARMSFLISFLMLAFSFPNDLIFTLDRLMLSGVGLVATTLRQGRCEGAVKDLESAGGSPETQAPPL